MLLCIALLGFIQDHSPIRPPDPLLERAQLNLDLLHNPANMIERRRQRIDREIHTIMSQNKAGQTKGIRYYKEEAAVYIYGRDQLHLIPIEKALAYLSYSFKPDRPRKQLEALEALDQRGFPPDELDQLQDLMTGENFLLKLRSQAHKAAWDREPEFQTYQRKTVTDQDILNYLNRRAQITPDVDRAWATRVLSGLSSHASKVVLQYAFELYDAAFYGYFLGTEWVTPTHIEQIRIKWAKLREKEVLK